MNRASDRPEISLVIPVYNEEGCLRALVDEIRTALDPLEESYEVLFVDDGSSDRSPALLDELAQADTAVRVVRLGRHSGKSAALDAGFRRAGGGIVVTLDADLQNDPADIPRLVEALRDCEVATAVRLQRHDSLLRRATSRVANAFFRFVTREPLRDSACGFCAYQRQILSEIPMYQGMHRFLPTLARLAGGRVREVPVEHRPRGWGQAKYGVRNRALRPLLDLLAVRWMQKRWIDRSGVEESSGGGAERPASGDSR